MVHLIKDSQEYQIVKHQVVAIESLQQVEASLEAKGLFISQLMAVNDRSVMIFVAKQLKSAPALKLYDPTTKAIARHNRQSRR